MEKPSIAPTNPPPPLRAAQWQVIVRVVPSGKVIEGSVDLAYKILNRVFRRVPERIPEDR